MEYLQYKRTPKNKVNFSIVVLNLIINGIPSIQVSWEIWYIGRILGFKPYYKWNTFNTEKNLQTGMKVYSFKPYYKWNTFNTLDLYKDIDFVVS